MRIGWPTTVPMRPQGGFAACAQTLLPLQPIEMKPQGRAQHPLPPVDRVLPTLPGWEGLGRHALSFSE